MIKVSRYYIIITITLVRISKRSQSVAGLNKSSDGESVRSTILITAVERVLKVLADSRDAVLEFLDS